MDRRTFFFFFSGTGAGYASSVTSCHFLFSSNRFRMGARRPTIASATAPLRSCGCTSRFSNASLSASYVEKCIGPPYFSSLCTLNTVPGGAGGAPSDANGFCASPPRTSPSIPVLLLAFLAARSSRSSDMGMRTASTKASTPLSATLPSSQNAFLILRRTASGGSRKSILESGSEEDIFPPARPGTIAFMR